MMILYLIFRYDIFKSEQLEKSLRLLFVCFVFALFLCELNQLPFLNYSPDLYLIYSLFIKLNVLL